MSLEELKEKLRMLMERPFNERSHMANALEYLLNKEGFGIYWDDSNERYCIYALDQRQARVSQ